MTNPSVGPGTGPEPYGNQAGGEPVDPNPPYVPPPGSYWANQASQYPQPGQYPHYPPPHNAPYGAYPGYLLPANRPGAALAAAVLAYIHAGLLILAGFFLFVGASTVNSIGHSLVIYQRGLTAELVFDGMVNLIVAGLLIGGAISMTGRNQTGRLLLTIASVVAIVEAIYWLMRFGSLAGTLIWVLLYGTLAVLVLTFSWTSSVSRWLTAVPDWPSARS